MGFSYHQLVVVGMPVFNVLVKYMVVENDILPTEEPHFSREELDQNYRLGCQ